MLQRAQRGWVEILINNESHSRSTTNHLTDVSNVPELLEVFEHLGPDFLTPGNFPVAQFVEWLEVHVSPTVSIPMKTITQNHLNFVQAPQPVRERVVTQRFKLPQLDTERLFRSLCSTPRYQYASGRNVIKVNLTTSIKVSISGVLSALET